MYDHFTTTYRVSCLQRVYKYYFPQGDMDLEASVCTHVTTTYKALCGTMYNWGEPELAPPGVLVESLYYRTRTLGGTIANLSRLL